jgi:hypothetical protein
MARPKRLEDILLARPLPAPDPRDLLREAERAEVMVKEVERGELEAIRSAPPAKTARQKLASAVDQSADALASHAVDQALSATGKDAVGAVTSLLDASEQEVTTLHINADEIESLSFAQLTVAVAAIRRDAHPIVEASA